MKPIYISDIIKDCDRFYIKVIYDNKFTKTFCFKTEKIAKAFRNSLTKKLTNIDQRSR